MHGRKNHGGQQQQGIVGPGGIALANREREQQERQIWEMVHQTEQLIYVGLVVKQIDLKLDQPLDPDTFRKLALAAIQTAKFFAEMKGLLKITLKSDAPNPELETAPSPISQLDPSTATEI